jgi:hypothetical protein
MWIERLRGGERQALTDIFQRAGTAAPHGRAAHGCTASGPGTSRGHAARLVGMRGTADVAIGRRTMSCSRPGLESTVAAVLSRRPPIGDMSRRNCHSHPGRPGPRLTTDGFSAVKGSSTASSRSSAASRAATGAGRHVIEENRTFPGDHSSTSEEISLSSQFPANLPVVLSLERRAKTGRRRSPCESTPHECVRSSTFPPCLSKPGGDSRKKLATFFRNSRL